MKLSVPKKAGPPVASDHVAVAIATGFGLGYLPRSPGTWGSLLGIAVGVAIHQDSLGSRGLLAGASIFWVQFALVALMFLVGIWAIQRTEFLWGVHDSGKIVWDEVIGQSLAILPLALTPSSVIAAFVLFRILDIWKPGPIGWADEHLPGAWGTSVDDVIAGIGTAIILSIIQALSN
jgi:phosphatidylglycerophosphatase A